MLEAIRKKLLLHKIHRLLAEEMKSNPVSYNSTIPYQGYDRIGLVGARSLEDRVREYGIPQLISPDSAVLDIGSNSGFFVTEAALLGRLAHGVEPNPQLNSIGRLVAKYLKVEKKTEFFNLKFESFETSVKYDLILSLAAFHTSDGRERSDTELYFEKVDAILSGGGTLIYESTGYSKIDSDSNRFGTTSRMASESAAAEIGRRFNIVSDTESQVTAEAFRRLIIAKR